MTGLPVDSAFFSMSSLKKATKIIVECWTTKVTVVRLVAVKI